MVSDVRCLDQATIESVRVTTFDGRNWEAHAEELAHLSRDGEGGPPSA